MNKWVLSDADRRWYAGEQIFQMHAFMRRLAYDRGRRGYTGATVDELRWPGYDRAWRAGQRRGDYETRD